MRADLLALELLEHREQLAHRVLVKEGVAAARTVDPSLDQPGTPERRKVLRDGGLVQFPTGAEVPHVALAG